MKNVEAVIAAAGLTHHDLYLDSEDCPEEYALQMWKEYLHNESTQWNVLRPLNVEETLKVLNWPRWWLDIQDDDGNQVLDTFTKFNLVADACDLAQSVAVLKDLMTTKLFLATSRLPLMDTSSFWIELRNYAEASRLLSKLGQNQDTRLTRCLSFHPIPLLLERHLVCMMCSTTLKLAIVWPQCRGSLHCPCGWRLVLPVSWQSAGPRALWPSVQQNLQVTETDFGSPWL